MVGIGIKTNYILAAIVVLLIIVGGAYYLKVHSNGPSLSDNTANEEQVSVITIGTFSKALGNTPYHVAKVRQMFEASSAFEGVEFEYVEFNDRPSIVQSFETGGLDVLFSAEIPAILNWAQGVKAPIVEVSGVAFQEIVVPVTSEINSVKELQGQRLAVLPGTSSHYCLIKVLNENSMTVGDIDIIYMSPAEARVEFEANRLPAWAVWAPWVEQVEVVGLGRPIADSKAGISSVMSVSPEFLLEHPDAVDALVEIIRESKNWVIDNPERAQTIAAQDLNLSLDVVKQAWPKFNWADTLDAADVPDFQDKAQFLADQNLTRNGLLVDVRDIIRAKGDDAR